MNRARIIIVVAIAAIGAIGMVLIFGAITKHKGPPQAVAAAPAAQPMAKVLVAKHDLPVGTRLTNEDLAWQDWPADAVNPAFITDGQGAHVVPAGATAQIADQAKQTVQAATSMVSGGDGPMQQLNGSIVREAILANEPVTNAKLVRGGAGGYMAVVLQPGMRAVALPVTVSTSAGGFILPGDHVDVVQSHATDAASSGGHAGFAAQVLLRNVRVLAIDQTSTAPKGGQQSMIGATATLEVAAADTELVARAKQQGEVMLALRPYSDANGPPSRGVAADDSVGQVRIFRGAQQPTLAVTQ